jgi:hypothetical protein
MNGVLLDSTAVALLLGVAPKDLRSLPTHDGHTTLPQEWLKQGRRLASEAQAHTGSSAMVDALATGHAGISAPSCGVEYDEEAQ